MIIGPTADAAAQDLIEKFCREHKNPTINDYKQLQNDLMPIMSNGQQGHGTQICIKSQELLNIFNQSRVKETMIR